MFTNLLNKDVYFLAQTIQVDGYGGQSVSLGTVGGPYPCRVRQLTEREQDIMNRIGIEGSYRLYCQAGITVLNTYLAEVDGVQYELSAPAHNPHFMGHHLQIDLRKREIGK